MDGLPHTSARHYCPGQQIIFLPGVLIPFFKHGILAWNGLLAFWIPVAVFTAWMIVLSVMLFGAIKEEERQWRADENELSNPVSTTGSDQIR